jgi:hypothetical protein
MNHRDSNKLARSVRLFPRLATPTAPGQMSRRRGKISGRRTNGAPDTDPTDSTGAQVRARLLKMILDNEQVRRNERRPNQG